MAHPWRDLRDEHPDWTVEFADLPPHLMGDTNTAAQVIRLDRYLLQPERRCTLAHELEHVRAGEGEHQSPWREQQIERAVARLLVPLGDLVEAVKWAHSVAELAEECWVDEMTIRTRLEHLTDAERADVLAAIAERDFHEEGWP